MCDNEVKTIAHSFGTSQDLETFFGVAWAIWYNRNQKVFENIDHSPAQVWNYARRLILDFKEASSLCCQNQQPVFLGWKAPPPGVFKINVDGATSADGRLSSIGVVIRDTKGDTIAALCKSLPDQYSSEETEIFVVENGVLLAKELELSQVYVESDALMVVQDIQAGNTNGSLGCNTHMPLFGVITFFFFYI